MEDKKDVKVAEVVPTHIFRAHLGSILEGIKHNKRFILTKRGSPVAILLGLEDYIRESSEFEDMEDFLDTVLEESDSEFQKSLREGYEAIKRGEFYTLGELKEMLAKKANV